MRAQKQNTARSQAISQVLDLHRRGSASLSPCSTLLESSTTQRPNTSLAWRNASLSPCSTLLESFTTQRPNTCLASRNASLSPCSTLLESSTTQRPNTSLASRNASLSSCSTLLESSTTQRPNTSLASIVGDEVPGVVAVLCVYGEGGYSRSTSAE
ncbi:uncharacterized protein [Montipora capricornis]|uniref:uncharacterized protein n=1 Tax=Montipora capricornis TaxID=246305 RepID=UPI0035F200EA